MNTYQKAILVSLTELSGVGDSRAYDIFKNFDKPERIINLPQKDLEKFNYIDEDVFDDPETFEETVESYVQRLERHSNQGIDTIGIEDERYPESVKEGPSPILIYVKGNAELLQRISIGFSGSRETDTNGKQWTRSLACQLSQSGYTIVSGGAKGTDTAAHEGAINNDGSTVVVLATGVDVAYPPENEELFDKVLSDNGALISMRPPGAKPTSYSFIERNKLIASLSDGMVFVAAEEDSGTKSQYEDALNRDIPIFAPPADLNITPVNGICEIRNNNTTNIISSKDGVTKKISQMKHRQSGINDWG